MKVLVPPDWRGVYRQAECGHRWPREGEPVKGLLYYRCTLCGYLRITLADHFPDTTKKDRPL
jgi:hypothetical protein